MYYINIRTYGMKYHTTHTCYACFPVHFAEYSHTNQNKKKRISASDLLRMESTYIRFVFALFVRVFLFLQTINDVLQQTVEKEERSLTHELSCNILKLLVHIPKIQCMNEKNVLFNRKRWFLASAVSMSSLDWVPRAHAGTCSGQEEPNWTTNEEEKKSEAQ